MEDDPADQLNIEVTLAERALGRFPHERERLRDEIVEQFPLFYALPQLPHAAPHAVGIEALRLRLQAVDAVHERTQLAEQPLVGGAEDLPCEPPNCVLRGKGVSERGFEL